MPFLDLHSHVLPGLDDGAADGATALVMLRGLAALGFDTVCATPHQKDGQFLPTRESIDEAHRDTRAALAGAGVGLELALGAENMWDSVFFDRVEREAIPCYGASRAFLLELPVDRVPVALFERLFELQVRGKLPVIAHPERYEALCADAGSLQRLRSGCALVVDLGAVAGYHGRRRTKLARALLEEGIAHAAASDAHAPADVRAAAEGIAWISKNLGAAAVDRLLGDNPRRIFAGEHPDD